MLRCLFFWMMVSMPLLAQNAVVSGRVVDATEATVPNASIELRNRSTGIAVTTQSNSQGLYVLPPVQPGVYDLTAKSPGFADVRMDAITLEVGQARTIPIQLQPSAVQQSITVADVAPSLTVSRPDRGTFIENKFVASIPLNARNPLFLLTLAPGVTTGRLAGNNAASQSTTNNFRINGGRGGTNDILIDGAANTGTYNNQVSSIPQVDSVQEFRVNTSPYAAEFGRTGGGVISFAIKSGTNELHGTAHEFLRNAVLDANGFNANRAGQKRPSFKRNQFGFTVGGPVLLPKLYNGKNRTFFFAAYEGFRERSLNAYTGSVPSEPERRGDFSQSFDPGGTLIRVFDPRTTRLDPDRPAGTTRYIRDPFPGNAIPANLQSVFARAILPYYPLPNQPGNGRSNVNNFFVAAANSLDADRWDARIDHQVSQRHMVFFRYNWFRNWNLQPLVFGNFASPAESPNRIPGINMIGSHTWTVSAGTIVEHHFSMAESGTNRIPLSLGFDQSQLGLPKSVIDGQRVQYFPRVSLGGRVTALGGTGTGFNAVKSRTWQYRASVTMLRGRHTYKAGFDWRRFPVSIDQNSPLSFSAGGGFTGGPNPQAAAGASGHGLADLFLNAGSVSYTVRPLEEHVHPYHSAFFQDEIKVNRKLTLTLGIRYNLELPRTEAGDRYVFVDMESKSPLSVSAFPDLRGGIGFVGVGGLGRRTQRADTNNWDPRIGLAYQVDERTVIRSGFGIFHHPLVPNTDLSLGFSQTTNSLAAAPDGVTPLFNMLDPFPQGIQQPTGNRLGLATLVGQGINGPVRQQRLPYQSQWSFDVQRQLPWQWVVDIGYAGNAAVALPTPSVQFNQIPDSALALGTQLNQTVANPFFGVITDPTSTLSRSTIQRGQLLRPFPQFTSLAGSQVPSGHSTYHAMQLRVERRFSSGLAILFAYTKSKLIDNVGDFGGFLGPGGFTNNNCFSCDRSLSLQDVPDVLRLSYRYDLPLGRGRRYLRGGVASHVIGGWSVAGFVTADNGTPISVSGPNDSNSFGGGQRPDATGQKARIDSRSYVDGAVYFNAAAFSRAPQFTFGTASRTVPDARVPGMVNWDLLVEKRFQMTERFGLDFRSEFYNLPNQVIFAGPNTTITSGDFGRIRLNQVNTPRQIQFGLRLSF
ncbi:MAG: TonB-dependent receptor [Bryobacterales bacterium]|nr:TonB-dependent receptor [Bryobacterales bacterium]